MGIILLTRCDNLAVRQLQKVVGVGLAQLSLVVHYNPTDRVEPTAAWVVAQPGNQAGGRGTRRGDKVQEITYTYGPQQIGRTRFTRGQVTIFCEATHRCIERWRCGESDKYREQSHHESRRCSRAVYGLGPEHATLRFGHIDR